MNIYLSLETPFHGHVIPQPIPCALRAIVKFDEE